MNNKANRTKQHIIETASPIFNSKGYYGTTLSDLTEATGLTKGAIYGNFKDKEELAVKAFNHNVRLVMGKIRIVLEEIESPLAKLYALTNFYRSYFKGQIPMGGCPILNVGVDTSKINPLLNIRVKDVAKKLQSAIAEIIEDGKQKEEIRESVNSDQIARRIFSIIEGGVFTSTLFGEDQYLKDMMNHLDEFILKGLQTNIPKGI